MRIIDADALLDRISTVPDDQFYNMTSIRNLIKAEPDAIDISGILALMILSGAPREEILHAVECSKVVIDSKKYLDDILEFKKKYQGEE